MRKKYLSALLFGALLFASAGTFTSCKDYDDDIDGLRTELTELKNAVSELQSAVDNGDYVTNVEKSAEGLVITFKTAGPKTITLEDQVGSTVEVKDGVLYIDGVAQDFAVAPGTETQDQIIIENGMWSVLQEDGTYKSTGVPVSGVTVSGSQAEGFVFTIYDADGTKQEVELPSAASLITSITVANDTKDFTITKATFNKPSKWAGKATMPEDGATIFTSSELDIRVNPVDAPAAEVEYYLTNAANQSLSNVVLSASSSDIGKGLTIGEAQGRAAYNDNGLFTLAMDMKVLTKSEGEAFVKELNEKAKADATNRNDKIAYAVNANSTTRSDYSVAIDVEDADPMTKVQIKGYDGNADEAILGNSVTRAARVMVNKDQVYTIENIDAEVGTLYDLYFEVSEKDATNYGLKTDDLGRTFQITKRPDVSTAAKALTLYVHTLDVLGNVRVATYSITLSDAVDTAAEYAPVTFPLSNLTDKNDKNNAFSIDINTMKEALGDAAWQEWFNATDLANTTITIHEKEDASDPAVETILTSNTDEGLAYELLKADGKTAATDAADLASIKMNVYENANALEANKQYYAKVTFNNGSSQEVNNIIVPVTFVAAPLSDLFEIASGFYNTELETITAYFRSTTITSPATTASTAVTLKDYFTKFVADAKVSALSTTDKVGETDKTEDALFAIQTAATTNFEDQTLDFNSGEAYQVNGKPAGGYGQILNLEVGKDNYAGWTYNDEKDGKYSFNIRLMSPIYEGAVNVVNNKITINGNDLLSGAQITSAMINGVDYNSNDYSLMPGEGNTWVHPQIANVEFDTDDAKYIKTVAPVSAQPAKDDKPAQAGYFKVTGQPVEATGTETLPIKVTDKWGLTLEQDVEFTVTRTTNAE